ncbi:MAG: PTS mannose transporter subunit IIAB [Cardiobacteriaceae bacterium]|nr:PTS mannose transporter subunit IIAB [Cardiobacteriaceae bacterium]
MIRFIVSGHGQFASGVVSAASLIAGEADAFAVVDFPEGSSNTQLGADLKAALDTAGDEPVIIFTDILGGMPFRESALLAGNRPHTEVVCGTNVQILVEAVLERSEDDTPADLLARILPGAREGLNLLSAIQPKSRQPDAEDGI